MRTLEVPCCPDYDFVVPRLGFGEDGKRKIAVLGRCIGIHGCSP
jgi:hypothetical protein